MDHDARQRADRGAVDADELQVAPDRQLDPLADLVVAPPPDLGADQRRELACRSGRRPGRAAAQQAASVRAWKASSLAARRAEIGQQRGDPVRQVAALVGERRADRRRPCRSRARRAAAGPRVVEEREHRGVRAAPRARNSSPAVRRTTSSNPSSCRAQRVCGVGGHVGERLDRAVHGALDPARRREVVAPRTPAGET